MAAADQVLELLGDVLGRRQADAAIVSGLVREKVPEGLYLEYKRGQWFGPDKTQDLRAYVSGFANAEGGLLIIGIVGGEDVQGPAAWSFEAPACPDKAGWPAWLGRVLSEIAMKTRVEWQVVPVNGMEIVLIATNRAQELIRVYEKPRHVCYLRIDDNTVPIDETLFADLALGRRAKPDLTLEDFNVRETTDSGRGFHGIITLAVHNQGLLWVPDLSVVWIGYARTGPPVSTSLRREIDIRSLTTRSDMSPIVTRFNSILGSAGTWNSFHENVEVQVKPFDLKVFSAQILGLPIAPASGSWAWCGAVMVLPKNGPALWAQVIFAGQSTVVSIKKAWALAPGTPAVVAWFQGDTVFADLRDSFGSLVVS